MYTPVCICVCLCVCVYVSVCVYVFDCVCICVSDCVCMSLCVSMCMSVYLCVWLCVYVCLCVYVYMYACMPVCVYECMCVGGVVMAVHLCASLCMHVWSQKLNFAVFLISFFSLFEGLSELGTCYFWLDWLVSESPGLPVSVQQNFNTFLFDVFWVCYFLSTHEVYKRGIKHFMASSLTVTTLELNS